MPAVPTQRVSKSKSGPSVFVWVFDLTCDDGGGLTSDLVLVHVFAVVQLPLY